MRRKTKLLLQENNRAEEALSAKGRELLTDIVVYLRGSRVSTWEQELVRRDITEMLLDAEARGDDAAAVIGPDPKEFCDEIIRALPPMPRWESLLCALRDGLLSAAVLMAIWLVSEALKVLLGAGSWPELTLTLGQLLSGAGILLTAFGVVYWICRRSFSVGEKGPVGAAFPDSFRPAVHGDIPASAGGGALISRGGLHSGGDVSGVQTHGRAPGLSRRGEIKKAPEPNGSGAFAL